VGGEPMNYNEYKDMREILDTVHDIQEKMNTLLHAKAVEDTYPELNNGLAIDEFNANVFRIIDEYDVTEEVKDLGYHE
jgi:hypothetical protein